MLIAGLVGAALAPALLMFFPLCISVDLRTGEPGVARLWLLGLDTVFRRRRVGRKGRRFVPSGGVPVRRDPSLERALAALSALLSPLRPVPVTGAEVQMLGGVGDAAATATLYGAVWAVLGALMTASGIEPRLITIEPRLDGPPSLNARARAEMRVPVWRILCGACLAGVSLLRTRSKPPPPAGEGA